MKEGAEEGRQEGGGAAQPHRVIPLPPAGQGVCSPGGYTWLIISHHSQVQKLAGAPSGDLRSTPVGTCQARMKGEACELARSRCQDSMPATPSLSLRLLTSGSIGPACSPASPEALWARDGPIISTPVLFRV